MVGSIWLMLQNFLVAFKVFSKWLGRSGPLRMLWVVVGVAAPELSAKSWLCRDGKANRNEKILKGENEKVDECKKKERKGMWNDNSLLRLLHVYFQSWWNALKKTGGLTAVKANMAIFEQCCVHIGEGDVCALTQHLAIDLPRHVPKQRRHLFVVPLDSDANLGENSIFLSLL